MRQSWLVLLMLFFGFCCGRDDIELSRLNHEESLSDLTFISQEMLNNQEAELGKYIVAFKSNEAREHASKGYLSSARWLNTRPMVDSMVEAISYLGRLNLSSLGSSFSSESQFKPEPINLRFIPSNDNFAVFSSVSFHTEDKARATLTDWFDRGLIWYAEPNYLNSIDGALEQDIIQTFDDPSNFPWLDQISFIDAMRYFDTNPPANQPIIAVLDSGVDVEHDALKNSIFQNESGQNILCKDDLYGCDTTSPTKDFLGTGTVYPGGTDGFNQSCGNLGNCIHGSHVAGIIAAQSTEYIGICPYCQILVVKLGKLEVEGDKASLKIKDESILAGLEYVSGFTLDGEPTVRVINASFGKFQKSRSVGLFIQALKSFGKGVLMIGAAGNEDTMKRQYPAAFKEVLAVANVNSNSLEPKKAPSSNFGVWVDIAAPGSGTCRSSVFGGILSSAPGQQSACLGGTSMATPIVAGIAGLILAANPDLSYDELRQRLLDSAIAENLYKDGINDLYRPSIQGEELIPLLGSGVANALAAVDTSVTPGSRVYSAERNFVKPGCGTIGLNKGTDWGVLWLILVPLIVPCKRLIIRMKYKRG